MAKILLCDDDVDFSLVVQDWLTAEHHTVELAHNGLDGLEKLRMFEYEVVILDWQMPGMNGIEICKQYRAESGKAPVLMLTSKVQADEKALGLDSGADDFLTKPAHPKELSARVRALLRRGPIVAQNTLTYLDIELDTVQLTVKRGEQQINLLPREFSLLEYLMRHPKQVFTLEDLLERVWNTESDVSVDTVRTCVNRIRTKLDTAGTPSVIKTVHRVGYTLNDDKQSSTVERN